MDTYPSISYDSRLSWLKINNLSAESLMREQPAFESIAIDQFGFNSFCFQALEATEGIMKISLTQRPTIRPSRILILATQALSN